MELRGGSGEHYRTDGKRKVRYSRYTDFEISGGYIARVYTLGEQKKRRSSVEDAMAEGEMYDGEYPINSLYKGSSFVGFVYEGTLGGNEDYEENEYSDSEKVVRKKGINLDFGGGDALLIIVLENILFAIIVFIIYSLLYRKLVAPIMVDRVNSNAGLTRDVTGFMAALNSNGVGALILGIVAQVWLLLLLHRQSIDLVRYSFLAAIGNLIVCIVASYLLVLLMNLIGGVIAFLARYLILIILIVAFVLWVKKKFRL